jgi:hypothetical protein
MVAVFQYSPMVTLSVNLPPSMLDFNCHSTQEWVKGEAVAVCYYFLLENVPFPCSHPELWL